MNKQVILKLEGEMETWGFRATLEIIKQGHRTTEILGKLPANLELATHLRKHWFDYHSLGNGRIRPKKVKSSGSISSQKVEVNNSAKKLEQLMEEWLKSEAFWEINVRLREELNLEDQISLLIRINNLQLQKLPWHRWNIVERYPYLEVALSPLEYKAPEPWLQLARTPGIRILAIFGHSSELDLKKDRKILEGLEGANIVFLDEPTRTEINQKLWENTWDIIFFAGHSRTENNEGWIEINSIESLTLDELWYALKKAVERGLQLAIFNSCDGLGLAKRLDDLAIPQMIVMREMVPDRIAQEFLKYFFTSLAGGQPCHLAFRDAREQLQGLETEFPCASWLPVLFQNPSISPLNWQDLLRTSSLTNPLLKFKIAASLLLMLGGLTSWHLGLPKLSVIANNLGFKHYQKRDLVAARMFYELALKLNPNNGASYYNLGWICQKARNFDCARTNYKEAAERGFAPAYSQLLRLSITEDKNYTAAIEFGLNGLNFVQDDGTKYSLIRNLAWVRLEQERYQEASEYITTLFKLDNRTASAYCLNAQILEKLGKKEAAKTDWQTCLNYADPKNIDHDVWKEMARQRLNSLKTAL